MELVPFFIKVPGVTFLKTLLYKQRLFHFQREEGNTNKFYNFNINSFSEYMQCINGKLKTILLLSPILVFLFILFQHRKAPDCYKQFLQSCSLWSSLSNLAPTIDYYNCTSSLWINSATIHSSCFSLVNKEGRSKH